MADRLNKGRFGAYFHLPFCDTKCIYCDFFSLTNTDQAPRFYKALLAEIDLWFSFRTDIPALPLTSVFFGGGTPSLTEPDLIGRLLETLFRHRPPADYCEITLESNPGTLDYARLKAFRSVGINRLSLGVQSFDDHDLKTLSRIHSAKTAIQTVEDAAKIGFSSISVDLIFGLPDQDSAKWKKNLLQVIDLPVQHVSAYNLIVEEKTPLFHMVNQGTIHVADDDDCADMYDMTITELGLAGFGHYEVSNFAQKGHESVHNRTYWRYEPWLAFGPSSWGFWDQFRHKNVRNLSQYCDKIEAGRLPVAEIETIGLETELNERLMLAVRTTEGCSLAPVWSGLPPEGQLVLREKFDRLQKDGYINWSEPELSATPAGLRFGDALATELMLPVT